VLRGLRDRLVGRQRQYEHVPEGWVRSLRGEEIRGWDVAGVGERHRSAWRAWRDALAGTGPLGADFLRSMYRTRGGAPVVETGMGWAHNLVMSYGYCLARCASGRGHLSILDWGGGVGQFYPLSKALVPEVTLDYHCKDVPLLCRLGSELNPEVHFHDDESWRERRYDLVFASSSLQYSEDWADALAQLAAVTERHLFLARVPVVTRTPSFVVLERAAPYDIDTEFLGWFLNRDELLGAVDRSGLELVREFVMMDETPVPGAPEQATYHGFLLRPAPSRPEAERA
jgi:putative methyltransferase (TIGR04325 family)